MRPAMNVSALALAGVLLGACAPKPGTQAWCEAMEGKPTLDWTAEEVKGYFSSCVIGDRNVTEQ